MEKCVTAEISQKWQQNEYHEWYLWEICLLIAGLFSAVNSVWKRIDESATITLVTIDCAILEHELSKYLRIIIVTIKASSPFAIST